MFRMDNHPGLLYSTGTSAVMRQTGWEGNSEENEYMYMYD